MYPAFGISPAAIRKISTKNSLHALAHLAMDWLWIVLIVIMMKRLAIPWLYPLAVVLIAARMHAIGTLAHDAVHYMLVSHRRWNDRIAQWLITFPLFYSFLSYRKYHLAHHYHLNTEKDPDVQRHRTYPEFQFPLSKQKMGWILLQDIVGISYLKYNLPPLFTRAFWKNVMDSFSVSVLVYYAVLAMAIWAFHLEKIVLLYWIIPYITWLQLIQRVRTIAEHNAIKHDKLIGTRTTLTGWIDHLFFGPKNTNYHTEHHLYPSVPFFNLPKLHKELMVSPEYKNSVHLTHGYFNVIRECL